MSTHQSSADRMVMGQYDPMIAIVDALRAKGPLSHSGIDDAIATIGTYRYREVDRALAMLEHRGLIRWSDGICTLTPAGAETCDD